MASSMLRVHALNVLVMVALLLAPAPPARAQGAADDGEDEAAVAGRHEAERAAEIEAIVATLYAPRGGTALWITPELRASEQAWAALGVVREARREGLDPRDYGVERIESDLRRIDTPPGVSADEAGRIDLALTRAVVAYADDLAHGRVEPSILKLTPNVPPPRVDIAATLDIAIVQQRVAPTLAALAPVHPEYGLLRDARVGYEAIAADGGWPAVPDGETLKPGLEYPPGRLAAVGARLAAEGFLDRTWQPSSPPASTLPSSTAAPPSTVAQPSTVSAPAAAEHSSFYDETLAQAVRAFQSRRGMEVDGVVGPRTLAELNRTADSVVRTIDLNMERWRWLPDRLGTDELRTDHVRVNVPAFELDAYEAGRRALAMRIIVGQVTWGTPLFSDRIEAVVMQPFWNVPTSIASKEVLPKAFADPSYLTREGLEIVRSYGQSADVVSPAEVDWARWTPATFPYRLRQPPGPRNPLGRIKFLLPNRHNIYLHDTPGGALFQRAVRAFSHGCIRVAEPLELAAWLFRGDPEWPRERLAQAMAARETRTIRLLETVPVHLLYFTAEVGEDGRLSLYPDLYGIDTKMNRVMRAARAS